MANFAKKLREFTDELAKQKPSEAVTRLTELLPSLVSYRVVNAAKGNIIGGKLVQAGSTPAAAWTAASKLVTIIGNRKLSQCFNKALEAAEENAGIRNTVKGNIIGGTVYQIGDHNGDLNL